MSKKSGKGSKGDHGKGGGGSNPPKAPPKSNPPPPPPDPGRVVMKWLTPGSLKKIKRDD